jgi:hypothetical protein
MKWNPSLQALRREQYGFMVQARHAKDDAQRTLLLKAQWLEELIEDLAKDPFKKEAL